jgi:hypothetical protein
MVWQSIVSFFKAVGATYAKYKVYIDAALTIGTLYVGVKGYQQAKNMLAKGQDILANKQSAGGKIPVIYGTRRVGAQIIYMDVSDNDSRDLYVVYALSIGECDEILGRTIELDGNPLNDSARFRDGGYIGSDKISSGSGSLNTVSQNGTGIDAGAGGFGTDPAARYRYVMNLHHGAASQTADPMLVASMPNWTSSHRLDGVCYIAAHYGFDAEGIWGGVPQLTVQVRGKKVFDPRDNTQTFGTVSTYKHSDNPALCFLDYITNNEYGKGLTQSQINMTTFSSAANVCDTLVDQPYFNGSAKSVTWEGTSGNDYINITGTGANSIWWQNKIGEKIDLEDGSGNLVLDGAEIKDVQRTEFYNAQAQYSVYVNNILGSNYSSQSGTSLLKVKRFHCNGYLDANKNVMDNAKELLANMRGIFLYIDGKYELSIEDTGSSTFSITDDHIISDSGISVDYGNKDKKANKVIVEFFNANKKYELDTATVLHDASPNYTSDDGGEVLEVKAEFPYISDPYIAYNMAKAILTRSRNQTTMQFLGTPEMYKLNVGDIVDLTYSGLGFSGKVCRVEALELQSNGLVAVSLIEYFDVYTWEVPAQEPVEELSNLPSAYAVKAPTGLSFTDTDSSSTGRPFLSWNEPTDFPDHQYRVNVVDSSSNELTNKIVDTEFCDLNFLPVGSNYVASVSSINTLNVESDPATLTFSVGDQPVVSVDLRDGAVLAAKLADNAVTRNKILNDAVSSVKLADDAVTNAKLAVDSIQGDVIAAGAITETKIGADAVTTAKIADNAITSAQIAADAVTTAKIADDAITTALIANDAIGTAQIANDAVTNALIATDAVNQDSIAANSVTATQIVAGTITASEIATSAITTAKIAADAITTAKIAAGAITASEITSSAITTAKIAAGAITAGKIGANEITAAKIASNTITANEIASNAITANELAANSVTSAKIVANSIVASDIASNTITATQIAANTITSSEILAGTIVASDIQSGTLTSASGVFGTISANDITTGTLNASNVDVTNLTADNITVGTLSALRLNLDGSTLTGSASGLKISSNGVSIAEIGTRAVGAMVVNGASGTSSFGDGRYGDNFNNLITATFTTAEAGDYQIVANCMVGGVFNTLTQLESRIVVGTTVVADYSSPVGGAAIQPVILGGKISLSANTSYTVAMQGQVTQDNTTPNIGGFSTRITALKLNKQ